MCVSDDEPWRPAPPGAGRPAGGPGDRDNNETPSYRKLEVDLLNAQEEYRKAIDEVRAAREMGGGDRK